MGEVKEKLVDEATAISLTNLYNELAAIINGKPGQDIMQVLSKLVAKTCDMTGLPPEDFLEGVKMYQEIDKRKKDGN